MELIKHVKSRNSCLKREDELARSQSRQTIIEMLKETAEKSKADILMADASRSRSLKEKANQEIALWIKLSGGFAKC